MARLPALPENQRFFARIDSFTCECPRCGHIIHARFDRPASEVRRDQAALKRPAGTRGDRGVTGLQRHLTYNPLTSRLHCPQCHRVFGIGLLAYPVAPRSTARQPEDSKPTYQQLLEIRRLAGGFLIAQELRADQPVNVAVEVACDCPDRGSSRHCPVHGWPELRPGYVAPDPDPDPDPDPTV